MTLLAHFGLVHALYGGFFAWSGAIGALAPDLVGLVGWIRYLRQGPDDRSLLGSWHDAMPPWGRNWYWIMHSLPFSLILVVLETIGRGLYNSVQFLTLQFQGGIEPLPLFSLGYLTHVLSDWVTHRQDVGDILLRDFGRTWGVDWFRTRFYWTEWTGISLGVLVFIAGRANVLLDWVR